MPRRSEAAHPALRFGQLVDLDECDLRQGDDHELGDTHARLDDERLARVGIQEIDQELAAVTGIDEPRGVDDRDPILRRKAGARLDEAGGGSLAVVSTNDKVLQIFEITGLDGVISLHSSREDAVSAFSLAG